MGEAIFFYPCQLAGGFDPVRFLSGLPHGAFFGIGAVVAGKLAKKAKAAQAIATMMAGLTVANVIGVPLGTYFGHEYHWSLILLTTIGTGGFFAWYSYIAPLIPEVAGHPERMVGYAMILTGLGMVIGNFNGRQADQKVRTYKRHYNRADPYGNRITGQYLFGLGQNCGTGHDRKADFSKTTTVGHAALNLSPEWNLQWSKSERNWGAWMKGIH